MNTVVTEKKAIELTNQISYQESKVSDLAEALDPSGWIIQYTGQYAEPKGTFIRLISPKGEALAAVVVAPAEDSQFQRLTQLDKDQLNHSVYLSSVWVAPDARIAEVLPAILYLALRRGRIWGRQNVAALIPIPNPEVPLATLLRLDRLGKVSPVCLEATEFLPVAQQLKYSIHHIYKQCHGEELKLINKHLIDEVLETHRAWLDRFFKGSWARAVLDGTLTKEQYISSLYNLHEYVRQTTRICARCIAHCQDLELRNHYIYHFKGEINHELLIERDLKFLGADLNYLMNGHIPDPATKEFMMAQESTIGFYQDPVLMLACPLAAEGVAAHMDPDFVNALQRVIASWGVKAPKDVSRFLTSHITTDGGDDGHWIHVVEMMKRYITDEHYLQRFLSVLTIAMNGFEHGFNANVDDLQLWAAKSKETNPS